VNSSFGFPGLPGVDLPSGGPIYPLAAPGVRLKLRPVSEVIMLGAAFNGDPAGPGNGDPQRRDASGTAFRFGDGVFAIVEVQYALNQQPDSTGLPSTYRFGGWYHSGQFADQRSDDSGLSLADPASSVPPRRHHGNYSLYAVADQMIWRKAGTKEQGIGLFARIMGGPGDRNLIDFYVDGGVNWKGFIEARPNDSVGFAIAYARISDTARRLDREAAFFRGAPYPIRDSETVIEATYSYQIARWWQVQPDIQYIIHPSGNVPNPVDSTRKLKNALIFGLRVTVTF
jgi:porin